MALIQRGTKSSAGGGTAFVTGTTASASEVNTDFDTIYNEFNGNISDANVVSTGLTNTAVASAAAIAETKIDDISATDSAHDDTTTPGDSSSHTLPTTLSGEVQQLRYVVERQALGIAPDRVDGSGTGAAGWYDLPARGLNLVVNPNFGIRNTASFTLQGWGSNVGSPTTSLVALSGAHLTEGQGQEFRIIAGAAAQEGISQTFKLKASTRYLVMARVRAVTNAAHLKTTGADATSSFRNIDDSTSSASYTTLKGVIQTDSTPTDIVVQIVTNGANADEIRVAFCGVYECASDIIQIGSTHHYVQNSTSTTTLDNAAFTNLFNNVEIRSPGTGYEVHIDVAVPIATSAAATYAVQITEGGTGVAGACFEETLAANTTSTAVIRHVNAAPTAGTALTYNVSGRSTHATAVTTNGTSLVTGTPTPTMVMRVRLVKVSG